MSNFSTKIASTASVVALVATAMSASLVSAASEFLPYAELLADNSVIGVQSNESGYRLGDTVTRAELAKITANIGGYTATGCAGTTYGDVSSKLGDLCGAIEALAEAGVVSTANANFRPNASVTRAEAVKMLLGAVGEAGSSTDAGYMDVANLGDLAMYINRANELGCAADATYFRPNATSSRGEAFKVAACVAGYEATTPTVPPTTGTGVTATGVVTVGTATVALDGVAAAQYVPQNASNVKVGTVKVTAGTSDVTVNSLTINRSGLGDSLGLTIAIGQSGTVISESRSVNSATQDAIVRLNNATTIKAGTTVSFDVLVSVTTGANSQHQFTLKAVGTTAAVTGMPITLGLINTTSYTVSTVKVVTVDMNSVTSGKNDQSLGTIKLQAGDKDTTFGAFILSKSSGVDLTKAIANVRVLKNGVAVGTASITSDKIYVSGLATKVARNDTVTFELRADVIHVGTLENLLISIAETTDVSAVEDITGYATATSFAGGTLSDTLVLSSLDIVWTKNSTKSVTVAPGATTVVLFDGKLASSASFDVTKFTLHGQSAHAAALTDANEVTNFTSLTLTVNGVDYDLLNTNQSANPAASDYVFSKTSDKFRVDSGAPVNVKLVANLSNSATPIRTYSYNVSIDDVKNVSNGNSVTGINKNITGDQVTVDAPTLTLKASTVSAPTASKIYSNATGLEIGRFALEAKAEEITVREITLNNIASNGINDLSKLISGTNVKLVNVADGTQVSATVTVNNAANGLGGITEIKFTGMSVKVPKDTTSNFKVLADTQGDLVTTFVTGVTGVTAVAEVSTFTVTAGTTATTGTITVNVNGTSYTTASITAGANQDAVALAIKTAIGSSAANVTNVATVTAATTGTQTDASVTTNPTGLVVTAATATQGVTGVTAVVAVNGGANFTSRVLVPSASSSSQSSISVTPYNTTKAYTINVIPPTVTLTKISANKFLMKITNVDADSDITLSSVTAQVRPVSVANSNFTAFACIRNEGSDDKCGTVAVANKVQAIPGAGVMFNITADLAGNTFPVVISKNSNITREISVDSFYAVPTDLEAEVTALNYGVSETYSVIAK